MDLTGTMRDDDDQEWDCSSIETTDSDVEHANIVNAKTKETETQKKRVLTMAALMKQAFSNTKPKTSKPKPSKTAKKEFGKS